MREKLDNWKWLCCHFRPHLLFLSDPFYYTAKLLPSLLLHAPAENIKPYFLLPDKKLCIPIPVRLSWIYMHTFSVDAFRIPIKHILCAMCIYTLYFVDMHKMCHSRFQWCFSCFSILSPPSLFSLQLCLTAFYFSISSQTSFTNPIAYQKNEQLQLCVPIWLLPTLST